MSRVRSMASNLHHAALLAAVTALGASVACGDAPGDDPVTASTEAAIIPCVGPIVYGDLTIASSTDAMAYRCVEIVHGNLTVTAAPATLQRDVDLSNLRSVDGDVGLAYAPLLAMPSALRQIRLGKLQRIGSGVPQQLAALVPTRPDAMRAAGPAATGSSTASAGRLAVAVDFGTTVGDAVAFDLAALSQVDGDVSLELKGNNPLHADDGGARREVYVTAGLASLTTVHGNLSVTMSSASGVGGNRTLVPFLPALRAVEGSVTFHPTRANENGNASLGLETVDGVTSVGGTLRFRNMHLFARTSATATALEVLDGALGFVGGAPTVQSLRIQNNPNLDDFQLGGRVVGSGPIVIVDNPKLDQCKVDAYVRSQRALGWTGTATTSGNLAHVGPCP